MSSFKQNSNLTHASVLIVHAAWGQGQSRAAGEATSEGGVSWQETIEMDRMRHHG